VLLRLLLLMAGTRHAMLPQCFELASDPRGRVTLPGSGS
jgi:hypothetical protein